MASELNKLTIAEASAMLRKREISALELTRDCLDRIAGAEPKLNAFITVCEKEATEQARQADARIDHQDCLIRQPVRVVQKSYREFNFLLFQWLVPLQAHDKEPVSDEICRVWPTDSRAAPRWALQPPELTGDFDVSDHRQISCRWQRR